jgi:hypothetical protein
MYWVGSYIRTIKKNEETLLIASKGLRLEVNADKAKYMVRSRDQNAGRNHSIKTDHSSVEKLEETKYFGTNLKNQNSLQGEINSRLKSGNACYHLVYNPLSSSLLSKNLKI